jgi:dienelactone hydrolase
MAAEGASMAEIRWTEESATSEGAIERGFRVTRDGETITGAFWRPAEQHGPQPLILLGHGGGGHKRNDRMLMLGQMFAGDYGWCAAAIDGPAHGDRGPVRESTDPEYRAMWQREGVVEGMVEDWRAVLDVLSDLGEVDSARVGYWGLSMGTMFGLPYVASDERIVAAVLGKAGTSGPSVERSGIDVAFKAYAPRVEIPVLFTMQWHDERFDRDGQFDLFDRIGSEDKRLLAYPGLHADYGPEAFDLHAEFLERYL